MGDTPDGTMWRYHQEAGNTELRWRQVHVAVSTQEAGKNGKSQCREGPCGGPHQNFQKPVRMANEVLNSSQHQPQGAQNGNQAENPHGPQPPALPPQAA